MMTVLQLKTTVFINRSDIYMDQRVISIDSHSQSDIIIIRCVHHDPEKTYGCVII